MGAQSPHAPRAAPNSPADPRPRSSLAVHNAILALAVVYCTDSRITSVPAGVFFSSVAKDSVESEVERPMLSTLQGLMLLGSVHSGAGKHGAGYFWGGGGMKMATTLGELLGAAVVLSGSTLTFHAIGLGIDATPHVHKGLISEETKDERERAHWFSFIQGELGGSSSSMLGTVLTPLSQTSCGPHTSVDLPLSRRRTTRRLYPASSRRKMRFSGILASTRLTRRTSSCPPSLPPLFTGPHDSPFSPKRSPTPCTPSKLTCAPLELGPSPRTCTYNSANFTTPSRPPSRSRLIRTSRTLLM